MFILCIFYWLFQGGTSFVDHLCFCVLCFSCFSVCSLLPCGHLLGKDWPLGSCWWCLLYFCYFPMWYTGSGVVLDCIISWSLPPFFLCVPWAKTQIFQVICLISLCCQHMYEALNDFILWPHSAKALINQGQWMMTKLWCMFGALKISDWS